VVGTYGLLWLYVGLTSIFLFFGGNGVAITFLPELPAEKGLSFLVSYFLVILATTLPYQIVASQVYNRIITLASFTLYAGLYFGAGPFLASHYVAIIWSSYLVLAIFVILAMRRLLLHLRSSSDG